MLSHARCGEIKQAINPNRELSLALVLLTPIQVPCVWNLGLSNLTTGMYLFLSSMVLVESIPQHMKYGANATFGLPLDQAWQQLISVATTEVDVVSYYWTLTGEDIGINSTSDIPVR